jgi:hypothetical protein
MGSDGRTRVTGVCHRHNDGHGIREDGHGVEWNMAVVGWNMYQYGCMCMGEPQPTRSQ